MRADSAQILWALYLKCGLFSNRDLYSTFERQPSVIGIAYNILGVSWTTMTKDLKEDFLALVMKFLCIITLVGALSVQIKKISFKLCIFYTLTYVFFMYFRWVVDSLVPDDFFRHSYRYFTLLLPSSVFVSPSQCRGLLFSPIFPHRSLVPCFFPLYCFFTPPFSTMAPFYFPDFCSSRVRLTSGY